MRIILAYCLLLCPAIVSAQTAGTLSWSMTRPADLVRFQVAVNGVVTSLGLPATNSVPFPLPDGVQSLVVSACYSDGKCEPAPSVSVTVGTPTGSPVDLGCWKDGQARALSAYLGSANSVSAALALCQASGKTYCGLQYGREVWAGDSGYDRYGAATGTCAAFGAGWVNHVWQVK